MALIIACECGWVWWKAQCGTIVFPTKCSVIWTLMGQWLLFLYKEPILGCLSFFYFLFFYLLWLKSSLLFISVWEALLPLLLYPRHSQLRSHAWNYFFCLLHLVMGERCDRKQVMKDLQVVCVELKTVLNLSCITFRCFPGVEFFT